MRWIVTVEHYMLRMALLRVLKALGVRPEEIAPHELRGTELKGQVIVLLEMGDPLRMLDLARDVYEAWGRTGQAEINFITCSFQELKAGSVLRGLRRVFRKYSLAGRPPDGLRPEHVPATLKLRSSRPFNT